MHGCGAGAGDGNACVEGSLHHFFFCIQCIRVVAGFFQIGEDEPQRLHCEQITERICLRGGVAFNSVAQRVDAGGSCDFAWQAADHLAVQNDRIRDHFGIDDADFQLFFGHRHDAVGRCLRAGTRRGGDHNGLDSLFADARVFQLVAHRATAVRRDGGQLGNVHHAAAADGDNQVCAALTEGIDDLLGLIAGGFGGQGVIHHIRYCRFVQFGQRAFQNTGCPDACIRKDGCFFMSGRKRFQRLHASLTAKYLLRHGKLILLHHLPFLSANSDVSC